jgi:ribosomal protein L11 methyltransferase
MNTETNDALLPVWHVLTLVVSAAAAETLGEELRESLGREPVQLERPGSAHVWLEVYFEEEHQAQVGAALWASHADVLATAVRRCDSRDWATFWQLHFQPRRIGERLLIAPAWDESVDPGEKRVCVRIVPGLSFGTGEHFTTRFCLERLEQLTRQPDTCQTMWDVGCGSGLLAVAGAALGIARVVGTDNDPVCLVQSAENAARNGVADQTEWYAGDILADDVPGIFDVVCANLFGSLLIQAAPALWSATGRYLVLSGIREREVEAVSETFYDLGAREILRDGDGDWAGLLLLRTAGDATHSRA